MHLQQQDNKRAWDQDIIEFAKGKACQRKVLYRERYGNIDRFRYMEEEEAYNISSFSGTRQGMGLVDSGGYCSWDSSAWLCSISAISFISLNSRCRGPGPIPAYFLARYIEVSPAKHIY